MAWVRRVALTAFREPQSMIRGYLLDSASNILGGHRLGNTSHNTNTPCHFGTACCPTRAGCAGGYDMG